MLVEARRSTIISVFEEQLALHKTRFDTTGYTYTMAYSTATQNVVGQGDSASSFLRLSYDIYGNG